MLRLPELAMVRAVGTSCNANGLAWSAAVGSRTYIHRQHQSVILTQDMRSCPLPVLAQDCISPTTCWLQCVIHYSLPLGPLPCLDNLSTCTLSTYDSISLPFQPPALVGNRTLLWNMMLCLALPYICVASPAPAPTLCWGTEQFGNANSHNRFVSMWACMF